MITQKDDLEFVNKDLENKSNSLPPNNEKVDVTENVIETNSNVLSASNEQVNATENVVETSSNILPSINPINQTEVTTENLQNTNEKPSHVAQVDEQIKSKQNELLSMFQKTGFIKFHQTIFSEVFKNIRCVAIENLMFLERTIDLLRNSYYIKSKPFLLTSKKTVFNILTRLKDQQLLNQVPLDTLLWFQYRMLIVCLRVLILEKVCNRLNYGKTLFEEFVVPLFFKNGMSFELLTDNQEKNKFLLKTINKVILKPITYTLKKDLMSKIYTYDYPILLKNLFSIIDLKNPPKLVTDSFVISLLLKDYYEGTKSIDFNPQQYEQIVIYLKEIALLHNISLFYYDDIDYLFVLTLTNSTQFINIPMSSLLGKNVSTNAFSATINVLDIFLNSFYIHLIKKLDSN